MRNMRTTRLSVAVLSGLLLLPELIAKAGETKLAWRTNATSVALEQEGKTVWQFNHGTEKASKPYFHPVAVAGGEPLTWESPADHVWHYGLWFSWKYLNGVNYWEENKQRQSDGTTSWRVVRVDTRPDFSAQIELAMDYRARGAEQAVLTEKRVISISAPAADGSFFMDWTQEFQAGAVDVKFDRTPLPGEPGGQTFGGYAGLSLRFAKDLKETRVAATSETGEPKENRYRFAASAADYSGRIGEQELGVAMLDHPQNPRYPTRWYAIVNPKQSFGFLNAAWLQLQPFELRARDNVTLRYRVLVHPGRWDAARLNEEQRRFSGK
jgi:hypothetical protein